MSPPDELRGAAPLTSKPFLRSITSVPGLFDDTRYPFDIPAFGGGIDLSFTTHVTFVLGENGSGKSTLLEALAECCGFNPEGGSRDHHRATFAERSELARALKLAWFPKVTQGFFMRAESFYNFATYLEEIMSDYGSYGGKSLHAQSHGESFLALFENRFEQGLYILDEPEAALSPQRQLAFLRIIHDLERSGHAQFIIATHSPILLAYPGATLLDFDNGMREIAYEDTDHFRLTRDFLNEPERYFEYLFRDGEEGAE